jgi:hypothetical protein
VTQSYCLFKSTIWELLTTISSPPELLMPPRDFASDSLVEANQKITARNQRRESPMLFADLLRERLVESLNSGIKSNLVLNVASVGLAAAVLTAAA